MKKFLVVTLCVFGAFILVSCGGDSKTHCESSNDGNCDYEVCAKENGSAWYEYNGKKYECEGSGSSLDCSQAAMDLYNACGGN